MRIAFISYEYAGLAGGGGIGTYVRNAARMLADGGHQVEVFTAGPAVPIDDIAGVLVHFIGHGDRSTFRQDVLPSFSDRHEQEPFDVVESPEYRADGLEVKRAHPAIPLVVKLHTPGWLMGQLHNAFVPRQSKARFIAGSWLRGRPRLRYSRYIKERDSEYQITKLAEVVTSPSKDLIRLCSKQWGLASDAIVHQPNVFIPTERLLEIPSDSDCRRILFFGKLEARKGMHALLKAIPRVLDAAPGWRFRLVGRSIPDPTTGRQFADLFREQLQRFGERVELIDAVPYDDIPDVLAASDICVFPSVWENFPNVCLEAMAAGRAVVASSAGGMAEMIEDGRTGRLIPPRNPRKLADTILHYVHHMGDRYAAGIAARKAVSRYYAGEVLPVQMDAYERALGSD